MNDDKSISLAVIKRLPKYYRYLGELLDVDITRISSKELSVRMNITASQIRQDLNNFGSFGLQGYGYNVELLYEEIGKILGLNQKHNLILIGAGNIGKALINYTNFKERGFEFLAIFDQNKELIGTKINNIKVYDVKDLESFIKKNNIDIATICVPKASAEVIAKSVCECGVKGIWNYSSVDIKPIKGIKIENVHLMDSLMTVSYKINEEKIINTFSGYKN